MADIEEDVKVLKKKSEELNEECSALYKNIANRLLSSADGEDASFPFLETNKNAPLEHRKLVAERALATDTILEIKTGYDRLAELSKFKKQILKSIRDGADLIFKLKSRFALRFYKDFKGIREFLNLEGYDDIEESEKQIADFVQANEVFSEEKREASFWAKFNLNRKIASNKLKISLLNKSIEKSLANRSSEVFDFLAVKDLYDRGEMQEDLKALYEKIIEESLSKAELENRMIAIKEEEDFLSEKMKEACKGLSNSKQISILNSTVQKLDEQIDDLLRAIAVEFLDLFLNERGQSKEKEDFNASLYETYESDIQDVANIRKQINTVNLNIEYCGLLKEKEAILEKLESMNRTIEVCEEGIENYQKRISSLKSSIESCSSEKVKLAEKLQKLATLIYEEV